MTRRRAPRFTGGALSRQAAADLTRMAEDLYSIWGAIQGAGGIAAKQTRDGVTISASIPVVKFIDITGPLDTATGLYPGVEVLYNPLTDEWSEGDVVWWKDANQ